jgi:hypothetical protein
LINSAPVLSFRGNRHHDNSHRRQEHAPAHRIPGLHPPTI